MEQLNEQYGIDGILTFQAADNGLGKAVITNAQADAEVYLQGAQLTHFQPKGSKPVIWMSKQAVFAPNKAIRGGIPICWPWFGQHATDPSLPQHGFARTAQWIVTGSETLGEGSTKLSLALLSDGSDTQWPHPFALTLTVTVGRQLQLALTAVNSGSQPIELGAAFHSYFYVADSSAVRISGLDGHHYLDKPDNYAKKHQQGDISITGEVDRIYLDTTDDCVIHDPLLKRKITVAKQGSASTVVWNPWKDKAKAMADFDDNGYQTMLCIESANAANDLRQLKPGERHTLVQCIAVE